MIRFVAAFIIFIPELALATVRSEVDRYKVIADKIFVEELHRELPHKFFLDLNVRESRGLRDVIEDGKDVSNKTVGEVTTFLNTHLNTEHFGLINAKAGIPLPKFSVGTMDFKPALRGEYDISASLSISILNQPVAIGGVQVAANDPFIQLYLKEDSKYGGFLEWIHESDFSGSIYLYYMQRWDRLEAVTANQIVNSQKVVEIDKPKNTTQTVNGDFVLKYDYGDTQFYAIAEEIEIYRLSDKINTNGKLFYGHGPSFWNFYAERKFHFYDWQFKPYLGVMKRSGYSWGRGIFGGSEVYFKDFSISALLNVDSEYVTFNPRWRKWVFQVEYILKFPHQKTTDGGVRTAVLHAVNIRVAI